MLLEKNLKTNDNIIVGSLTSIRTSRASNTTIPLLRGDEGEDIDLPMLQFEVIVTSTENFSLSNKLGQGGFGPVYKACLF